jgi:hypothetical protein
VAASEAVAKARNSGWDLRSPAYAKREMGWQEIVDGSGGAGGMWLEERRLQSAASSR